MAKLAVMLSLFAFAMGAAALVMELQERDDVVDRLVFVHNASHNDDVDDKAIRANCPRGSVLLGGGAAINHGHQYAPSGALYMGLPIEGGWEVQAHETDPAAAPTQPWTLEAIAICLRR